MTGNADPDSINILAMILVLMRVDIFDSGFGESIIIFGAGRVHLCILIVRI